MSVNTAAVSNRLPLIAPVLCIIHVQRSACILNEHGNAGATVSGLPLWMEHGYEKVEPAKDKPHIPTP